MTKYYHYSLLPYQGATHLFIETNRNCFIGSGVCLNAFMQVYTSHAYGELCGLGDKKLEIGPLCSIYDVNTHTTQVATETNA